MKKEIEMVIELIRELVDLFESEKSFIFFL